MKKIFWCRILGHKWRCLLNVYVASKKEDFICIRCGRNHWVWEGIPKRYSW